jgi:hypothetical protein
MVKVRHPARSIGVALAVGLAGCSLIVGNPHGRLPEPVDAGDGGHAADASNDGPTGGGDGGGSTGDEAGVDAQPGCNSECPTSVATFACAKGACNAAGGACTTSGEHCACDDDSQCPSGKCVRIAGENDLSCGALCTGSGAADGFGCEPQACTTSAFGYAPSNFIPTSYTPPANATIDCNGTYSSTSHTFTAGSCGGQAPIIHSNVTQTHGGQAVDILVFNSLTISGSLTLVGANPVILAVYGNARISGTINAGASGSTPGAGGNNCAAASNGTDTTTGHWEPGAGGGGQAAAGGAGGTSMASAGGAGGGAQTTSAVPLTGGCAGGVPNVASLGFTPAAGAGGGGLQISAAGSLDLAGGTLVANGSNGGAGEPGECQSLYPAQNGTGGAGGGSGGVVLLEGSTMTAGAYNVAGGTGGAGGAAASPNNQAGGAGGAPGTAGGPGVQMGTAPSGCSWGGFWSGGGGGGGANGFVRTNSAGGACVCTEDSSCSSGVCSNASSLCTGTCSGTTTAGSYDTTNCQTVSSRAVWSCAAGNCSDVTSPTGSCTAAGVPCWCTADVQCAGEKCARWAGCPSGACTGSGTGDGFNCVP